MTGGLPPIVPYRPAKGKSQARRWVWKPLTNIGRTDIVLHHWQPLRSEAEDVKPWNEASVVLQYSDDEYQGCLEDSQWSRSDTDRLFQLCRDYELRFVIIHDRFNSPERTNRTIEDLKDRFYSVCRTLVSRRNEGDLNKYQFDKQQEESRKTQLKTLMNRSRHQMEEEEILLYELKRREANEDKMSRCREVLLHSLLNHEMNPQINPGLAILGSLDTSSAALKKKRRLSLSNSTPISAGALRHSSFADDSPFGRKDKHPPGVYLRSARVSAIKASLQPKVNAFLEEAGVGLRPAMPTESICAKFESIRHDIVGLLEVKRLVERCEADLKAALVRKRALTENLSLLAKRSAESPPIDALQPFKRQKQ